MDARTDIWSFGCVLFEMLTGRLAFGGATVTDILSAIVSREPDWDRLPPETSDVIRRLLRKCLAKDVKRRLRHIADARLDLDDTAASAAPGATSLWCGPRGSRVGDRRRPSPRARRFSRRSVWLTGSHRERRADRVPFHASDEWTRA